MKSKLIKAISILVIIFYIFLSKYSIIIDRNILNYLFIENNIYIHLILFSLIVFIMFVFNIYNIKGTVFIVIFLSIINIIASITLIVFYNIDNIYGEYLSINLFQNLFLSLFSLLLEKFLNKKNDLLKILLSLFIVLSIYLYIENFIIKNKIEHISSFSLYKQIEFLNLLKNNNKNILNEKLILYIDEIIQREDYILNKEICHEIMENGQYSSLLNKCNFTKNE